MQCARRVSEKTTYSEQKLVIWVNCTVASGLLRSALDTFECKICWEVDAYVEMDMWSIVERKKDKQAREQASEQASK